MCKEEVYLLLLQVDNSLKVILERSACISCPEDFTHSGDGMMRMDSICMQLVTVGEAIKNIDKYTQKQLFSAYPSINWRSVMGLRDIIAHQYFNVDEEIIFRIVKVNIPELLSVIEKIILDLKTGSLSSE
ncbi:DUF86 domain-containing protein [Parabacteroides bouchesdurhonensis]|uniref:HepT-like ribonuclease domain-containing protein n=1 Tax=Parabacteroides bouchesdurhonensis TaxID=1936995 RepID=UPI000C82C351|nr:HepT-like ribonuclease domain-containing protein [Parabacteroides bouchesdurhonensis]